ncbi:MAG: PAS domain-containing protein [Bacilli bacterium]
MNQNNNNLNYLNELVSIINNDKDAKEFYLQNKDKFLVVSPFDVFSITEFQNDKLEISRIKDIAGKIVNLLRTGLLAFDWNKNISLIQKLLNEANKIREKFNELKEYIKAKDFLKLRNNLDIVDELKKRFLKMQNVIFTVLEKKNINNKPLKVMWSLQDEVLIIHKKLLDELNNNSRNINITIGKYFFLVLGILEKEELFILPILSNVLKISEFEKIEKEIDSYGYAFISDAKEVSDEYNISKSEEYLFESKSGKLNLDELISILSCVGDITFVDNNNKVKFFNTPHQHFARSSSIIGRDVRNCHPEKSIHIVEEIIAKFRNGNEDRVDFWINIKGKLILISYFAIRNKENKYLGVLELTQDITDITKITGEKRILDFNSKK